MTRVGDRDIKIEGRLARVARIDGDNYRFLDEPLPIIDALLARAVRSCAGRGVSHLVCANWIYGQRQESSLRDFRQRNGFERVDAPRDYVPLTRSGSVAFALRLHHNLAERVPEPVAAKLRDLRSAWYQRKFHLSPTAL